MGWKAIHFVIKFLNLSLSNFELSFNGAISINYPSLLLTALLLGYSSDLLSMQTTQYTDVTLAFEKT